MTKSSSHQESSTKSQSTPTTSPAAIPTSDTMETPDYIIAFILLNTESAETHKVLEALRGLKEVLECHMIYGDWDIICKIRLNHMRELADFMLLLREHYAIKKSSTMIALPY